MNTLVYTRFELLRAVPQHPLLRLLAGVPARPVLPRRRAEPPPEARRHSVRHLLHDGHDRLGHDGGGHRRRGPYRRRTVDRMEPAAARHPAAASAYFRAKVLTGYLMAASTIGLLYLAGTSLGVRLAPADWVTMTVLILIGLIPFAVLGILLGHLLTVDSMGPALGGLTALFALLGGAWGPITSSGVLHRFAEALPSYWLVQAGIRRRWWRLAGHRLARDRHLDGGARRAHRAGVQARHGARVMPAGRARRALTAAVGAAAARLR